MEENKQLEKFKRRIGVSDNSQDDLLKDYLEDAKTDILELTHLKEIPGNLLPTQIRLAVIYYNKEGIEGQISHSEGGVSRSYIDDLPKEDMRKIRSARRLPRWLYET